MMKNELTDKVRDHAARSFYERTGKVAAKSRVHREESGGSEICRILLSGDGLFVSAAKEYGEAPDKYLSIVDIADKLRSPGLYTEILGALGLDAGDFILEPSEEFSQDIRYNVTHTLEYVCAAETFIPYPSEAVVPVVRGDGRFILGDEFSDTMYCITDGERIAGASFFRPNTGDFAGTYAMEVFTRSEYRRRGYGTVTASAATAEITGGGGCALWVCQVENEASRKIAEALGYVFIGGEIRIMR